MSQYSYLLSSRGKVQLFILLGVYVFGVSYLSCILCYHGRKVHCSFPKSVHQLCEDYQGFKVACIVCSIQFCQSLELVNKTAVCTWWDLLSLICLLYPSLGGGGKGVVISYIGVGHSLTPPIWDSPSNNTTHYPYHCKRKIHMSNILICYIYITGYICCLDLLFIYFISGWSTANLSAKWQHMCITRQSVSTSNM